MSNLCVRGLRSCSPVAEMREQEPIAPIPSSTPPVAFLGICERASLLSEGHPLLSKYNLGGVKRNVVSMVYPLPLAGMHFLFALYNFPSVGPVHIRISDQSGAEIRSFVMSPPDSANAETNLVLDPSGQNTILDYNGWFLQPIDAKDLQLFVGGPGRYSITAIVGGSEAFLGELGFYLLDPPALTPDRVAAIRSDPGAAESICLDLGCPSCGTYLKVYTAVERSSSRESEGEVWYQDLPTHFACSCGAVQVDLTILRRNMHGLLGQVGAIVGDLNFSPMYERGALREIATQYARLLRTARKEEELQVFIDKNPILLHPFTPTRIIPKAPILTLHKTDFAIVNSQRELILVELEKPNTKLLRKDGGVNAELQHALDQVNDWLHVFGEQRLAVLDCMGLARTDVAAVRGVVVAGRSKDYSDEQLRRLRARDFGRVSLMTYDDLGTALSTIIDTFDLL
jgi:hypothetical protein